MNERDTWPLILEEEHRHMFDNTALRKVTWQKRGEVRGTTENYIIGSFMICTPHQVL
jgi:hypothetical protein